MKESHNNVDRRTYIVLSFSLFLNVSGLMFCRPEYSMVLKAKQTQTISKTVFQL